MRNGELTPVQLLERQAQQRALLFAAAPLVKPGGTLAYVTCSLLPQENDQQIEAFLESNALFTALDVAGRASAVLSRPIQSRLPAGKPGLLLTPARHATDGLTSRSWPGSRNKLLIAHLINSNCNKTLGSL